MLDINNTTIDDQILYVNKELKKNRAMSDIEKNDCGVHPRVLAKRFERRGYKKVNNQYTFADESKSTIIQKTNQGISVKKTNDRNLDFSKLQELIDLLEPIKEVIHEYNESKNIIEIEKPLLKPFAVTEVKQKLFKIDVNVIAEWEKFIAEHKEFKVQQLISLALKEFIDKYK